MNEEMFKELGRYRNDYFIENGKFVGEAKTLIMDAQDSLISATQDIYEWCGETARLLAIYLQIFDVNPDINDQQKELFVLKLADGLTQISCGKAKLEQSSVSFNKVAGKLNEMTISFALATDIFERASISEADQKSAEAKEFFRDLKSTIDEGNSHIITHIDGKKNELKDEVKNIGTLKIQIVETMTLICLAGQPSLHCRIVTSVNNLIAQCDEYQRCH